MASESLPKSPTSYSPRSPEPAGTSSSDVVVIGAGPAGSTAAANLANQGASVTLVERMRFPRFHIGESLLPASNPVLERLGVLPQLRADGEVVKRGATLRHESGQYDCSIRFLESLQPSDEETLQVRRSRFDELLLQAAVDRGVRVLQPARVNDVTFDSEGVEVQIEGEGGTYRERARYVIDASGQSGLLAKKLSLRTMNPALRNVAVHGHFAGVEWSSEVPTGDIQVISRRDLGWIWLIPLSDQTVSVGLVLPRAMALRGGGDQFRYLFLEALRESESVREQLGAAVLEGPVRRDADYSYEVGRYAGDRWLLAGDAGSFLDPVFSTGVTIALQSGEEASATVAMSLREPSRAARHMRRFDRRQRSRYRFFSRFVRGFYRPGFRDLLCQKSDGFRIPAALTAVLAGHWTPGWAVRWRLEAFYLLARIQESGWLVERLHHAPLDRPMLHTEVSLSGSSRAGSSRSVAAHAVDHPGESQDSETVTV